MASRLGGDLIVGEFAVLLQSALMWLHERCRVSLRYRFAHRWIIQMPRDLFQWPSVDVYKTRLQDVPIESTTVLFYRQRNSHRGISEFQSLRRFGARQVNQDFLEEICSLEGLELLSLETVTADDLRSLTRLKRLRTLRVANVRNASEFEPLAEMTWLQELYIEDAKHLSNVEFLENAHHLQKLGVEGSMWNLQKVASLKPLRGLRELESLFMTSVELADEDLAYLANCKNLSELECARFAPKSSFEHLRQMMPNLKCNWCDNYEQQIA